jgi:hypothetical protein
VAAFLAVAHGGRLARDGLRAGGRLGEDAQGGTDIASAALAEVSLQEQAEDLAAAQVDLFFDVGFSGEVGLVGGQEVLQLAEGEAGLAEVDGLGNGRRIGVGQSNSGGHQQAPGGCGSVTPTSSSWELAVSRPHASSPSRIGSFATAQSSHTH